MGECMPDIFLHGIVDAPSPPEWIIEKARSISVDKKDIMNDWGSEYVDRTLQKDGQSFVNSFNRSLYLDDECLAWARENVTKHALDIRSTYTLPGLDRNGPHIDRTRFYTLIYLLQGGGPDHRTVFYRENGVEEYYRPLGYHVDDYSQVTQVAEVKLTENKWNLLEGRVLHSIENIPNSRKSVQVSLNVYPDDVVMTDITSI